MPPDLPTALALPTVPGSYLLVIRTAARLDLAVGRLGPRTFPRGWHVYAGSARGGLAGRLRHHLAGDRPLHWHVDVLRQAGTVAEVWVVAGRAPLECSLARAVAALPGARLSPRFGSSDCRCAGHLVSFSRRPALGGVWPGLARLTLGSEAVPGSEPRRAAVPTSPVDLSSMHTRYVWGETVTDGLPQVTERDVHRALRRDGWRIRRQGANHTIFDHPTKSGIVPVPRHRRLTPDTVRAIIREMGLSVDEFRGLL